MKKLLAVLVLALVASPAFAGISGTAHDLSDNDAAAGNEICVYCHTPHGADTTVALAPLWNRSVANATAFYTGLDINNTTTLAGVNASDAPLCLSCHDGVLSETLKNEPNSGSTNLAAYVWTSSAANLTADLTNDHPVGMVVTDNADLEIQVKATVEAVAGMTGALSFGTGNNEMWCSSCHDVHSDTNGEFLRVNNAGSNLCLACHEK